MQERSGGGDAARQHLQNVIELVPQYGFQLDRVQGATDMAGVFDILPGYLKMANPADTDLAAYLARVTPKPAKPGPWDSMNYWSNTPRNDLKFLKAMYGDAARKENQWAFQYLPKIDRKYMLLLFVYQGYSSPLPWAMSNLQIAMGLLVGSVIWIAFLSILGLALSSWVKWRVVATGVIFAAVFVPAGVGAIVSAVLRTKWGLAFERSCDDVESVAETAGRTAASQRDAVSADAGHSGDAVTGLRGVRRHAEYADQGTRGGPRMNDRIIFEDVSKFYGEVLGVNRISLSIPPGITTLVGPNGSGKTTIMNLMTGLVQPSNGHISVLGLSPAGQAELFSILGYCTQFDFFPRGLTGWQFVLDGLMLHGMEKDLAVDLAEQAIERVQLGDAAGRKIAGYSKGMRQKIRLAQAIAHHPRVLVLDEPLNGLDPMARAESIALFQELGRQGMHVLISSHILDEVDQISDRVILITGGYLIAEGNIHQVRQEVREKPMQVLIRCDHPEVLASRMFAINHCVEARLHADGKGVFLRTGDIDQFYTMLNGIAADGLVKIDAVAPADDDANAIYQYLIGTDGSPS